MLEEKRNEKNLSDVHKWEIVFFGFVPSIGIALEDGKKGSWSYYLFDGTFDMPKNKKEIIEIGSKIYWDYENGVATTNQTELPFGYAEKKSGKGENTIRVRKSEEVIEKELFFRFFKSIKGE